MANLIVYFSRKGENYCSGTIRKLAKGNTEVAAKAIKGADRHGDRASRRQNVT